MDVRQGIEDLRFSLEHTAEEQEVLRVTTDRLAALRQAFPSCRSLFTPSDIEFLKSLTGICGQLRAFVELKEELQDVGSPKECEDILSRLVPIKDALAGLPAARRVTKEIRELQERLPAIRDQDEARRKSHLNFRILGLEQNPRCCRRKHPMVIREGLEGHFWGCTRYPFCRETAQLTPEENDHLLS